MATMPVRPVAVSSGDGDVVYCGNQFNSLRDLILSLIHHHHPDPPDPWIRNLTQVAEGLQTLVVSTRIHDSKLRASVAREGLENAKEGLNGIKIGG